MTTRSYVVCTTKPWNVSAFRSHVPLWAGNWRLIEKPEDLTIAVLEQVAPRYIFFPHWSWRVPSEILNHFECVCFHMADVPYGRGGSPLQNLISRGHKSTMLTALRMVEELDAGPVYIKRPLSLAGRAEEIFIRAAGLVCDLILDIVTHEPKPIPQTGDPIIFRRREPAESEVPKGGSATSLYDFIRMLDAPTYPKAFLEWGNWRFEFDHAIETGDSVEAHVVIRAKDQS
jgi:methionyl-tRNA formyltransferase